MKKIDGHPIINATKPVTLRVSKYIATHADRKAPNSCAIAKACKSTLHAIDVRVHLGRVYVRTGYEWVRYATPSGLRTEIIAFDRGGDFAPGDYTLSPPAPSKKTGKRQGTTKGQNITRRRRTPGVRALSPLMLPHD